MLEQRDAEATSGLLAKVIGTIFTEKIVGLAFAIAFASWSWNLHDLKSTVTKMGAEIANEIVEQRKEIQRIKDIHQKDREESTAERAKINADLISIRERQIAVLERLQRLEK